MKASELRISNWVHLCDGIDTYEIQVQYDTFSKVKFNPSYWKPIPLTEEWLLKFGFKPLGKDWQKNGIIIHTRKRGFVLRKSVPIIEYVHQLQNLVYALTGKELETEE